MERQLTNLFAYSEHHDLPRVSPRLLGWRRLKVSVNGCLWIIILDRAWVMSADGVVGQTGCVRGVSVVCMYLLASIPVSL